MAYGSATRALFASCRCPAQPEDVQEVLRRIERRVRALLEPRLEAARDDARPPDALAASQAESVITMRGTPPDAAKQRMNALWASVRPMFERPKPTQQPAAQETEAEIVARLSTGWTHPDPRLFETIHMTKGRD